MTHSYLHSQPIKGIRFSFTQPNRNRSAVRMVSVIKDLPQKLLFCDTITKVMTH